MVRWVYIGVTSVYFSYTGKMNTLGNVRWVLKYLNNNQKYIRGKKRFNIDYQGLTNIIYIKGKFSKSYNYLKSLYSSGKKYTLGRNDCVQTSLDALLVGTFNRNDKKNKKILLYAKSMKLPNKIYSYLKKKLSL